ncbi:rCG35725, partial [Rattus norvegicus]
MFGQYYGGGRKAERCLRMLS